MPKTVLSSLFSIFLLIPAICQPGKSISVIRKNGALVIHIGEQAVLSYQHETADPPPGVDPAYRRSGFIHPLRTLNGHILTRIQPDDHYHHYGIWNPWTHVLFASDTVDFWNLGKKEGTVRFAGFKQITHNDSSVAFEVLHEHVVLKLDQEMVALNELQTIKVFQSAEDQYGIDLILEYRCATKLPFRILEYRYGGLGWRATEKWHKGNSAVLTSEGKTREDADGTPAKWVLVQGQLGSDYGGMAMFSHPQNYNHPEPLRIWPADDNERGDVFVNIAPTKNKDWLLEPGKTYTLKYRLVVFDGRWTARDAEALWTAFTTLPD